MTQVERKTDLFFIRIHFHNETTRFPNSYCICYGWTSHRISDTERVNMNRSVRSFNNNQNKSLEHVIIFGRSSRICFNFKTNHTATKQSCPQFPSLISAHLRQKQALGDCLRRVCLFCIYIFSYSVTFRYWLPFKVFWA